MPPRSKLSRLPKSVQKWLDDALVESNFSGYELLSAELKKRGYDIGKNVVNRRGREIQERLAAIRDSTEMAKAIAEAAPDDDDKRSEALLSITQHELFEATVALKSIANEEDAEKRIVLMSKATRGVAELVRASAANKRLSWESEARRRALQQAAERVDAAARAQGMDADQARFWREQVLQGLA